jgi:DNA-3-methyladenine glycosylase II
MLARSPARQRRFDDDQSNMQSTPVELDPETYRRAISELASRDADLARVLSTWGEPPFWTHSRGFPGIVISILAQQVSLESAEAAFAKLERVVSSVSPEQFLTLDDHMLRGVGFSRQKASYVRGIAHGILTGDIDLRALEALDDDRARRSLMGLKGIGSWTADAYLLFALRRADTWPSGDLALLKAIQELKRLPATLAPDEANAMADHWRPWRGVAARMLWYHYLCLRGRIASA